MEKRSDERGAIFTIDLIVSMMFFIVVFLALLWIWTISQRHIADYNDVKSRLARVEDVSQALVSTGGNPSYWWGLDTVDDSTVNSLGLAKSPNELDFDRLEKFITVDYEDMRKILGFGSEQVNITVSRDFSRVSGSGFEREKVVLYSNSVTFTRSKEMVIRRYALLNGTRVELMVAIAFDTDRPTSTTSTSTSSTTSSSTSSSSSSPSSSTSSSSLACAGYEDGGYCWYMGESGQSCDAVCTTHGGCNTDGWNDDDECTILKQFVSCTTCDHENGAYFPGLLYGQYCLNRQAGAALDCSAQFSNLQRLCACSE